MSEGGNTKKKKSACTFSVCFTFTVLLLFLGACVYIGFRTNKPLFGVLALLSVLPSVLIMYFMYWHSNSHEAELPLVCQLFLTGMVGSIPTALVESAITVYALKRIATNGLIWHILLGAAEAYLVAGLCEELLKYLIAHYAMLNTGEFNHPYGAVVYSLAGALGFATLENVGYVFTGDGRIGLVTALFRAALSVPLHATTGVLIGVSMAEKHWQIGEPKSIPQMLLVPILIHGTYDFLLSPTDNPRVAPLPDNLMYIFFVLCVMVVIGGIVYAYFRVKELREWAKQEDSQEDTAALASSGS